MARLTQRFITRYAKYNALKNALDKWLEAKKGALRDALLSGQRCPDRGPYLIETSERAGRVDWKNEWRLQLKANGYLDHWIDELFASIEARPRDPQVFLLCKINPAHRGKINLRLPPA